MRKLLTILMFVMMIGLVSASFTSLGTFKQDDQVTIRQLCASCSYNNITSIVYPNGTLALNETAMYTSGVEYLYVFNDSTAEGEYKVNGFGDLEGTQTVWGYSFEVTGTGSPVNDNYPFVLGLIILVTFGISIMFIYLTEKMEAPGMKIFFMILSFVFLLVAIGFGIITMQEMNVPENISSGSTMLLFTMGMILLVVIAYILIKITRNAIELYKINSGLYVDMESPY